MILSENQHFLENKSPEKKFNPMQLAPFFLCVCIDKPNFNTSEDKISMKQPILTYVKLTGTAMYKDRKLNYKCCCSQIQLVNVWTTYLLGLNL